LPLASLYRKKGDKLAYLRLLEELFERAALYGHVCGLIGEFYREHGYYRKALYHYKEFLNRYPTTPEGYYLMGLTYLDMGQNQRARKQFKKALQYAPGFPAAYYYLGIAYLRMQQMDQAYENIKTARDSGYGQVPEGLVEQLGRQLHRVPGKA